MKLIKKIMVRCLSESEFFELSSEIKKEKMMNELLEKFKNKYKDKYSLQTIEDINALIYNYFKGENKND